MKRHIGYFLAISALLVSCFAFAEEESVSSEVMAKCKMPPNPTVPNGRTANKDEMLSAQTAMKAYQAQGNEYLACLDELRAGWGENITDEQKAVVVIFYNRVVDQMHTVGDLYNQAVRAYKGREGQ